MVVLLLLSSCEHKEICYSHPHFYNLTIAFDWQLAPDAAPEGMCVYFYPVDIPYAQVERFDFSGRKGGKVALRSGTWRAIAYNNDTEAILFRQSGNFNTHHATTRQANLFEPVYGSGGAGIMPRELQQPDEQVALCPDMLWGDAAGIIMITGEEQTLTFTPRELVCRYSYEIRNVSNLEQASQMCASLSGMSTGVVVNDGALHTNVATLPFGAMSDHETSTVSGEFFTFGHHGDHTGVHLLTLYVWLADGSKFYFDNDVTEQVENAPDPRRVHLIIDKLDLPKPISGGSGSGFQPSVDGWDVVEQEIIM